ncbi:MAG: sodium:proton antiporter NhaD [Bacteroidales bacterium]|nr:sodium:proton antiporter NhaD [Bacteroidales bacterium]MDD4670653.1 sodium:proton antiporter NhaD [Bacteroidales bacterium]
MSTSIVMLIIFCIGYLMIALEHKIDINKTATALFIGVALWIVLMVSSTSAISHETILGHVGDIGEILFFLMGAMTIVELVDNHNGFSFIIKRIKTHNSVRLLWIITFTTFFLSAILDNMTTAIIMIMILRKLVGDGKRRWLYAGIVILAANAGGAFSPIGDVTTIMLWIQGNITSGPTIIHLFLPALTSVLVPLIFVSFMLKGQTEDGHREIEASEIHNSLTITDREKNIIFYLGVGGLMAVPVLKATIGVPPFMGMLGVLSILWLYTEFIYGRKKNIEESIKCRVSKVITHIDMPTILFFFGILMAVAALQEAGILTYFADFLDKNIPNIYLINGSIGILSSIIDNVPLVAGAMGMYSVADPATIAGTANAAYLAHFMVDGAFWQLLAYCAGVGGSLLIIGSAAGVVVMGLEKIDFVWYVKHISFLALVGYLAGIGVYYLQSLFF